MSLHTLESRRIQMILTVHRCLNNTATLSLKELLTIPKSQYNLRSNHTLKLPKVQSTKHGLKSWRFDASKQWNSLPHDIRALAGTNDFHKTIRKRHFS